MKLPSPRPRVIPKPQVEAVCQITANALPRSPEPLPRLSHPSRTLERLHPWRLATVLVKVLEVLFQPVMFRCSSPWEVSSFNAL
jgi:hypothetical protein